MGAALISAAAVVVAAIIGIFVARTSSHEGSARLLREAEAFAKLPEESDARRVMADYMQRAVTNYAEDALRLFEMQPLKRALIGLGCYTMLFGTLDLIRRLASIPATMWSPYWGLTIGSVLGALLFTVSAIREYFRLRSSDNKLLKNAREQANAG